MSTLTELEVRVRRIENRWRQSDQEFFESMNEVAQFQARIARVASLAAAVAAGAAMRVVARHWVQVSELWAAAFAIAIGILVYALVATWLDRWRVQERDELRRRYPRHDSAEPDDAIVSETQVNEQTAKPPVS